MKKRLQIIFVLTICLCVLFSSVTVLAEPDENTEPQTQQEQTEPVTEPSTQAPEIPTEPETTQEDFEPSDYDTTEPRETERVTATPSTTRKQNPTSVAKPDTTKKPQTTKNQTTTRKPVVDNNRNEQPAQATTVTTTEGETLPKGQFYVYLERNNGESRLKRLFTKPELVPEPESPVREGFVFEGWYKDPECKVKWDFRKDIPTEEITLYAKWSPDPNAIVYSISVQKVEGGTIEVNPPQATVGEPIVITVHPDEGMRLVLGSVTINGKATDILTFSMPAENVVVNARFEVITDVPSEPQGKKSPLPFILVGIAFLVVAGVIALIIIRRRDSFSEDEIDENGTIIDDDTDMSWVDESIVVADGFKDGERVIGNFIPEEDFTFEEEDINE